MKECKNCHAISDDTSKLCMVCGYVFDSENTDNKNTSNQQNNLQDINVPYTVKPQKNVLLAVIMTVFIAGIGHAYFKLYKRGAISFIISVLCNIIVLYYCTSTVMLYIMEFISLAWSLYIIYDVYLCGTAINQADEVPLFLGYFKIN